MAKRKLTQEIINKYMELLGYVSCEKSNKGNTYVITKKDGSKFMQHQSKIIDYVEFQENKTKKAKATANLFKIEKSKQIKKEWKAISCSMTKEEIKELKEIASKNSMTINELLRQVLLKVIESNK